MTRMKQATCVAVAFLALSVSGSLQAQKPAPAKTAPAKPAPVAGKVYLTPTCGCCSKWVDHMTAAGFALERSVMPETELDKVEPRQKVPETLRSCHTAVVGRYVIEGHVPADVVQKLLKARPVGVIGLSAPNMPPGSPGMEAPNAPPYSIVAFKADGSSYEYAKR
jgi:hypothetical protein